MKMTKKIICFVLVLAMTAVMTPCGVSASTRAPSRPVIKSLTADKSGVVRVRWSKSKRAARYTVYVRKGTNNGWKYWKSVKKNSKNKKKYSDRLKYRLKKKGRKYRIYKRKHPYRAMKKLKGTSWSFKGEQGKTYGVVVRAFKGKKKSKYSHPKEVIVPASQGREIKTRPLSVKDLAAGIKCGTPQNASSQAFNNAAAAFAVDLFKRTAAADTSGSNILISPDSVMTALAMVQNGAQGATLTEMESMYSDLSTSDLNLYLSTVNRRLRSSNDIIYQVANSIWAREGDLTVSDRFLETNKMYHDASFFLAPFDSTTVTDMNNWVYNNTRNMIEKIIDALETDDKMVVINTIAFEGDWEEPFTDGQVDTNGKFTPQTGSQQTVNMLSDMLDNQLKPYIEVAGAPGFVKYYKGRDIAFCAILPPRGTNIDTFIQTLSGSNFISAWRNRNDTYQVKIKIPEFKYDYGRSLAGILQGMGMQTAFTDEADFSGIIGADSEVRSLKVGDVLHKTHIELDRNGTKAAAVTAVVMKESSAMPGQIQTKEIYLNRPFVYALVDCDTGIPLFIGLVKKI